MANILQDQISVDTSEPTIDLNSGTFYEDQQIQQPIKSSFDLEEATATAKKQQDLFLKTLNKKRRIGKSGAGFDNSRYSEKPKVGVRTLNNIYDADTYTLDGDKASTRAMNVDAYETPKSSSWFNNPNNVRRMDRQRKELSLKLGRPVTNEEVFAYGKQQADQAKKDFFGATDKWQNLPSLVNSYQMKNKTEGKNILNDKGYGTKNDYGRNLGVIQTIGGMGTNRETGEEQNFRKQIGELEPKQQSGKMSLDEKLAFLDKKYQTDGAFDNDGFLGNLVDAAQYGIGSLAAKTGDMAVDFGMRAMIEANKALTGKSEKEIKDTMRNNLKNKYPMMQRWFDDDVNFTGWDDYKSKKYYGYDDTNVREAQQSIKKAIDSKDIGDITSAVLNTAKASPALFLESIGYMASTMNPITLVSTTASMANDFMEEIKKNKNGEDLDAADRMQASLGAMANMVLEKVGVDTLAGKAFIKAMPKGTLTSIAGKSFGEGVTEAMQQPTEDIATKYRTNKEKELTKENMVKDAIVSGVMGAGAGGVPVATQAALNETVGRGGSVNKALDKIAKNKQNIYNEIRAEGINDYKTSTKEERLAKYRKYKKENTNKAKAYQEGTQEAKKAYEKAKEQKTKQQEKDIHQEYKKPNVYTESEKKQYEQGKKDSETMSPAELELKYREMKNSKDVPFSEYKAYKDGFKEASSKQDESPSETISEPSEPSKQVYDEKTARKIAEKNVAEQVAKFEKENNMKLTKEEKDILVEDYVKDLTRLNISDVSDKVEIVPEKDTKELLEQRKEISGLESTNSKNRVSLKNPQKSQTFSVDKVNDEVLQEIFEKGYTNETLKGKLNSDKEGKFTKLLQRTKKGLGITSKLSDVISDIYEKAKSTSSEALKGLVDPNDKFADTKKAKIITLTLAQTKSTVEEEFHLNKNANLGSLDQQIARKEKLAKEVGKAYFNSYGLKLSGSSKDINEEYIKQGQKMIDFTRDAGYLNENKAELVIPELYNPETEQFETIDTLKSKDGFEGYKKAYDKFGKEVDTKIYDVVTLADNKNDGTKSRPNSDAANASVLLRKLIEPANYKMPSNTEPTTDVIIDGDLSIPKTHQEMLNQIQKLQSMVQPEAVEMLKQIKRMIYDLGSGDFDKAMNTKFMRDLLGTEFMNNDIFEDSNSGRNMNRKDILRNLIENIDLFENNKPLYFTYKKAKNDRIHVLETMLEFQGDKRIARNILTGGNYNFDNKSKLGKLSIAVTVESIAEGLSKYFKNKDDDKNKRIELAKKQLLNPTEKVFVDLKNELSKAKDGQLSLEQIMYFGDKLNIKNPFEAMKYINGFRDIQNAKKDNSGNITSLDSNYMVEFDASASGLFNTLLNLSGQLEIQDIIKRFKVKTDGKWNEDVTDPYNIVVESISDTLEYKLSDSGIKQEIDKFKKAGVEFRDLVKYLVIPWVYGSSNENVANDMAFNLTGDISKSAIDGNVEAINVINSAIGSSKYSNQYNLSLDKKDIDQAKKLKDLVNSGDDYVVYDTETTGLDTNSDEIIQVSLTFMHGNTVDKTESFYMPTQDKQISDQARDNSHGISNEDLAKLTKNMDRNKQLKKLAKMLKGKTVVAHKSDFDVDMTNNNMKKAGINFQITDSIDTVKVAKATNNPKESNSLGALYSHYNNGETFDNAHNAEADTIALGSIIQNLVDDSVTNPVNSEQKYIGDLTEKDFNKVVQYFKKNLSSKMSEQLDEAFPGISKYRARMEEIYKLIEKTGNYKGTIRSAIGTIYDLFGDGSNQKMSIKKERQFVEGSMNGLNIISNKEFNNLGSFKVNLQHSVDAALLIVAVNRVIEKTKTNYSMLLVHDADYTKADLAILVKEEYEKLTVELAKSYDFIDMALKELEDQINKMPKESEKQKNQLLSELKRLREENEPLMKAKSEFLNDDFKTDIFGSSISRDFESTEKDFKKSTTKQKSKAEPKVETKTNEEIKVEKTSKDIFDIISELKVYKRDGKQIQKRSVDKLVNALSLLDLKGQHKALRDKIVKYLKNGDVKLLLGDKYEGGFGELQISKDTKVDPRTFKPLTEQSVVEILAHELDHALTYAYTIENKNSGEVKYLMRAMKTLQKRFSKKTIEHMEKIGIEPEITNRLMYMFHNENLTDNPDAMLSEFLSIIKNEPAVLQHVYNEVPKTFWNKIIDLYRKITKWISSLSDDKRKDMTESFINKPETLKNTIAALSILEVNSLAYGSNLKVEKNIDRRKLTDEEKANETELEKDMRIQKEIFDNGFFDPMKKIDDSIQQTNSFVSNLLFILGDEFNTYISPKVISASNKIGEKFPVYQSTLNLIDYGFTKSEFSRKMQTYLGVVSDYSKPVMNEIMQTVTEMSQETNKILTDDMPNLHKRILSEYKKEADRNKLHSIFTKTGFAGLATNPDYLKDLISGDRTIDEMIKDFESRYKSDLDKKQIKEARSIAEYYVFGENVPDSVNVEHMALINQEIKAYVALVALSKIDGSQEMIVDMKKNHKDLFNIVSTLTMAIKATSDSINLKKERTDNKTLDSNAEWNYDFDGYYTKDVFDKKFEYKIVSNNEIKYGKYSSADDWIVVKEPTKNGYGVVARESFQPEYVKGVGLNQDRFFNGFFLDEEQTEHMKRKLDGMTDKQKHNFLRDNNMILSGGKYRVVVSEKAKIEKLGLKQDLAQTLWRTYAHNKELIESDTVRKIVVDKYTKVINTPTELEDFAKKVERNDKLPMNQREIIEPFLKLNFKWDDFEKQIPKPIINRYMTPKNISNYNSFRNNFTFVRKDMSDMLVGHEGFSISGDRFRTAAKYEKWFKELIVMFKMKLVVTNPIKLVNDLSANATILASHGISPLNIYKGFKKGFGYYTDLEKLRSQLVQAKLDSLLASTQSESVKKKYKDRITKIEDKIKKSEFFDAYKYGFVQSYSTDLMVKEFDSISGLQKDINDLVDYVTTDKDGNKNEIHKAIKWWMNVGSDYGFTIDHLFAYASNLSKINGTKFGDELAAMSKRLKSKKELDSVAEYIGDIVGSPSSEIVGIGGAFMTVTDALSKYTLAQKLMSQKNPQTGKRYTKEEAYMFANDTFVDFRPNMPEEIRILSDYGILMFPSFWLKIQRIIAGLFTYKPVSTSAGFILEDALGLGGANIVSTAFPLKVMNNTVVNSPTNAIDISSIFPFL